MLRLSFFRIRITSVILNQGIYLVPEMCKVLGGGISKFINKVRYGSPRITVEFQAKGLRISRPGVTRAMRKLVRKVLSKKISDTDW